MSIVTLIATSFLLFTCAANKATQKQKTRCETEILLNWDSYPFCEKLSLARCNSGLGEIDLADELGVDISEYLLFETCKKTPTTLQIIKLEDILKIKLN